MSASSVLAQAGLPDSVIAATSITSEGKVQIKQLIDASVAGLSGDPSAVKKSRAAIMSPLRQPAASAEFRSELGTQLRPVLDRLLADTASDTPAINALAIAGELATRDGVEVLIKGLSDKRQGVAVRAGLGLGRTFVLLRDSNSPLVQSQVDSAVAKLKATLTTSQDSMVLEAAANALGSALSVPDLKLDGLRARSVSALLEAMSSLTQRSGVNSITLAAQVRATRSIFDRLSSQGGGGGGGVGPEMAIGAAGLAGDVLAGIARRGVAGDMTEAERLGAALLTAQAERVYALAHKQLDSAALPQTLGLDQLVRDGKDEQFRTDSAKLIGADGVLCKPPFGFKSDRFVAR